MGKLTKEMKYICKMKAPVISIFPEEDEFYRKRGISSVYLGHPLVDICPLEESKVKARQFLKLSDQDSGNVVASFAKARDFINTPCSIANCM